MVNAPIVLLILSLASAAAGGVPLHSDASSAQQESIRSLESGLWRIAAEAKGISKMEEEKHSLLMSQAATPWQHQDSEQMDNGFHVAQQYEASGEDPAIEGSSPDRLTLLENEVVELRHEMSEAKQVINRMQVQASLGRARAIAHSTRKRFLDVGASEATST
mmetsp:Transcript_59343/g.109723  ORF Transcript_59343/g.109723 Transcript_59343/m.109723 type:complete len:162 (+) Transcript_59343:92-577(+)